MAARSNPPIAFIQITERWKEPSEGRCLCVLLYDNWNDFGYRTSFSLTVFNETGEKHMIGGVKIASTGMEDNHSVKLPSSPFKALGDRHFSLGMSEEYYENLKNLTKELRESILLALRDMAYNEAIWEEFRNEEVAKKSLLRGIAPKTVEGQYRRISRGGKVLTEISFNLSVSTPDLSSDYQLSFEADPYLETPPTNVHAIIGRNGTGKTFLLRFISEFVLRSSMPVRWDSLDDELGVRAIAGIVFVSFSPFDRPHDGFHPGPDTMPFPVSAVSLHSQEQDGDIHVKTPAELTSEFIRSVSECAETNRFERWANIIRILNTDPGFADTRIADLQIAGERSVPKSHLKEIFENLSSGHKIVLLSLTRLVESTVEKTLVLIDEPETHLHPPLLASFIRAVSELMHERNGIAIVATHSPVVLQEVPRCCVWKLDRFGGVIVANRPEIETFGENIGTLTREVFSYEVMNSGFNRLLKRVVEESDGFEEALHKFGGQLGGEGQAILRGLLLHKKKKGELPDA